ncbi:MAG: hypothetical protein QOK15_2196 [Nocardioidaceae bacterium]|nr:hypothetical protein [Nocardioidaceae bacterium]
MNEFTHLNQYSATAVLHQRAGTPHHRVTSAGSRHGRRRSARRTVASGLHRLAERLDT